MIRLLALAVLIASLSRTGFPNSSLGEWRIVRVYDNLGQPIGLNAKQERDIEKLSFKINRNSIQACGKRIQISSVRVDRISKDVFISKYNFSPELIGFRTPFITDITADEKRSVKACGDFADPGTHLLIEGGHSVLEVDNDYFQLARMHREI